MAVTLENQIRCVQREIGLRERVYPKWVRDGKMKERVAQYEIEAMKAVLATLLDIEKGFTQLNSAMKGGDDNA